MPDVLSPIRATHLRAKRYSRGLLLRHLRDHQPVSRSRIAEIAGLTPAAVSRITQELLDAKLIAERDLSLPRDGPGRPSVTLSLSADGASVLALGLEVSRQRLALVSLTGEALASADLGLESLKDADTVLAAVTARAADLIKKEAVSRNRVLGMGVATIGLVDAGNGVVLRSPFLGWGRVAIGPALAKSLRLAVAVDSHLNAINASETESGVCRGRRNVLFVHVTLAVGASLYFEGRLIRGSSYAAGQIGHTHVSGAKRRCACGRIGCLNTVASGHAILADLHEGAADYLPNESPVVTTRHLAEALKRANAGDRDIQRVNYRAGRALGKVLAGLCTALNPDALMLGGVLGCDESYARGVRDEITESAFTPFDQQVEVLISRMRTEEAAVWLALDRFAFSPHLDNFMQRWLAGSKRGQVLR